MIRPRAFFVKDRVRSVQRTWCAPCAGCCIAESGRPAEGGFAAAMPAAAAAAAAGAAGAHAGLCAALEESLDALDAAIDGEHDAHPLLWSADFIRRGDGGAEERRRRAAVAAAPSP